LTISHPIDTIGVWFTRFSSEERGKRHWCESGVNVNTMPLIKVREDESLENALKRFKRKCEKSGILTEIKKRQHYEKPSVKRKRKTLAARKKLLKRIAQERKMHA